MLASVYSYRVMVKSVSSCCVRGRWVLSNPVTYMYLWHCYLIYVLPVAITPERIKFHEVLVASITCLLSLLSRSSALIVA